ncbi:MAG: hypothetical protein KI785_00780 [Devosiaceae bacterium]|nr:hypothetical protein [Devosiaceae bacterium MH13]
MAASATRFAEALDDAAFGLVYGSISVIAVLMALHQPIEHPWQVALTLFGTVAAVSLAKAFAEIYQQVLSTGRQADWSDITSMWSHCRTVLLAANGPALAFALAGLGLYSTSTGLLVAHGFALALLGSMGALIG